ncbi:probable purine permease 5 [Nymphaea colorata]|nr:probable purine permease 5 [Nymphaea colorata]XP_031482421.1 probable purine permease 5 [Nymphaea colorata]XP_031482422.1 probable purine permease 5 [Nymphaea colorata]
MNSDSVEFSVTMMSTIIELKSRLWRTFNRRPWTERALLFLSGAAMLVAFPASSLLSRLYFANGGKSKWIISWVAVAGWPLTALLLVTWYFLNGISPTRLTAKLCFAYVLLGLLSAADNLMFAWAYAFLPASTASLIASSSLVFSAIFGYALVGNKLNSSAINAIVIITAGTVLIGLDSSSDRLPGVTNKQYAVGFIWDILGSALHGLIFALSELLFMKILGRRSFHVVLEQQTIVSLLAFVFTTIGAAVNKDFKTMRLEASSFKDGQLAYYMVLLWGAITFQLGVAGSTAILYLASTVMAGVLNAVRVPLTSLAAVALFHDPMSSFKILAIVLTVWGFASYIYGFSSARKSPQSHNQDLQSV